jgi:hypothetical protein
LNAVDNAESVAKAKKYSICSNTSAILPRKLPTKFSLRSATSFVSQARLACHITDAKSATDCSASLILLAGFAKPHRSRKLATGRVRPTGGLSEFTFCSIVSDPLHSRSLSRRSLGVGGSVVLKVSTFRRNPALISVLYIGERPEMISSQRELTEGQNKQGN